MMQHSRVRSPSHRVSPVCTKSNIAAKPTNFGMGDAENTHVAKTLQEPQET
jgi:hypothetical protein